MIKTDILILEEKDLFKPYSGSYSDFRLSIQDISKYNIICFQGNHSQPLKILKNRFGAI